MIGKMAVAIALPGFNDLGRSVTTVFLLMDHFLYRFTTFSERINKIYRLEVCKIRHRIPFQFSSSFIRAAVSNAS